MKIVEALGCRYLQYLLKEMTGVLVKGYQVGAPTPNNKQPNLLRMTVIQPPALCPSSSTC